MIEAVNGSAEWPKVITNLRIFCLNCDRPLEEHIESPSTGIAWCPNGRTEFSPEEYEEEE